jgi:leucyl-tRNA synthetase
MAERYDHSSIEKAAQEKWAQLDLYRTDLTDATKDPYYLLFEFPYPSGDLHTGHWYAFAVTDIYARFKRMKGFNVLFPIGFDAFGLPAENAAMKNGADPREWTLANMERMRTQIRTMGTSVDWSKEVVTCDPDYYHWTQWLFSKLFEHGLAERKEATVKWCPKDQTVLANEQVIDGHCERCGSEVEEKTLTQWFLAITKYAERLLNDLDVLPWKEDIKDAQRAWIGKSEGAKINFVLDFKKTPEANNNRGPDGERAQISVFTTRPDTIFGATYIVLAPDHPWVALATDAKHNVLENKKEIRAYVEQAKRKTERERSENKEKTGVELKGVKAINPATKEEIPMYVADYVLASYGTGAVMAVPAHDERDFAFAKAMDLPIRQVVIQPYYQSTEPGKFRPDEPVTVKDGIIALIKHWSEDKYIGLRWKEVAWGTLLTGGVDEGFTPEETVCKEIREETGFLHPKIVTKLGVVDGIFYHVPKQKNQHVHGHMFVVQLEDGEQEKIAEEENSKHEIKWLSPDELPGFLTADTHKHTVSAFFNGAQAYTGSGVLVNSGEFSGRDSEEAKQDIVAVVGGERTINYRLRDWLVSRQRYWGCPIPVVYDPEGKPHLVPAEHLPWLLPTDVDFKPNGNSSPLASSAELKERVTRIFGEGWTPEYDTLDTFVDSSWYFMRYLDPKGNHDFSDAALMKKWLPVDRYSGGSEHTTMHLLYSRFFVKALNDLALVPVSEPFVERFNRGLILGPDGQKMSKSKGNVLNPDEFVQKYGADALRVYLAFIGPYNEPGNYPWNLDGVVSMHKFLGRVAAVNEHCEDAEASDELKRALARAAEKVATDSERFKFNTAISALMVCLKEFESLDAAPRAAWLEFLKLLAPFAPHLAEHLWEKSSGEAAAASIHAQSWPSFDPALLTQALATVTVQVNGKRRGELELAPDASEEDAVAAARNIPAVAAVLGTTTPKRVVYVPGRILNIVI